MTRGPDLNYCGACGVAGLGYDGENRHECAACGWVFYRNPAAAVFAILRYRGDILFVRRAQSPALGTLDLPGGFVDRGEDAESALTRELREELSIDVDRFEYVGTFVNEYPYRGVVYDTVDVCYTAEIVALPTELALDEVACVELHAPDAIDLQALSFQSVREAIARFRA